MLTDKMRGVYGSAVFWALACGSVLFAYSCSYAQAVAGDVAKKAEQKGDYKFVYDAANKRNPFAPLVSADGRFVNLEPPEKKGELALEGVIYDPHGISCAVVNGIVVKVSDEIEGYQVLRIEKDKVVFIKDGQISEVILKKGE